MHDMPLHRVLSLLDRYGLLDEWARLLCAHSAGTTAQARPQGPNTPSDAPLPADPDDIALLNAVAALGRPGKRGRSPPPPFPPLGDGVPDRCRLPAVCGAAMRAVPSVDGVELGWLPLWNQYCSGTLLNVLVLDDWPRDHVASWWHARARTHGNQHVVRLFLRRDPDVAGLRRDLSAAVLPLGCLHVGRGPCLCSWSREWGALWQRGGGLAVVWSSTPGVHGPLVRRMATDPDWPARPARHPHSTGPDDARAEVFLVGRVDGVDADAVRRDVLDALDPPLRWTATVQAVAAPAHLWCYSVTWPVEARASPRPPLPYFPPVTTSLGPAPAPFGERSGNPGPPDAAEETAVADLRRVVVHLAGGPAAFARLAAASP
jgi:hypothetical protein